MIRAGSSPGEGAATLLRAPRLLSRPESSHPTEEAHFRRLYLPSRSHNSQLSSLLTYDRLEQHPSVHLISRSINHKRPRHTSSSPTQEGKIQRFPAENQDLTIKMKLEREDRAAEMFLRLLFLLLLYNPAKSNQRFIRNKII